MQFLSTLSLRRATCNFCPLVKILVFLSTLSLRRATILGSFCVKLFTFLSTLSLRRATTSATAPDASKSHFYPRSPCGERHGTLWDSWDSSNISIHDLLAESDNSVLITDILSAISIHALLAESDRIPVLEEKMSVAFLSTLSLRRATETCSGRGVECYFYPRSPCGERHDLVFDGETNFRFLSTLSLRRATFLHYTGFSIPSTFLSTLSLRRATARPPRQR